MSPWWRDALRAQLGPQRVQVLQPARRWPRRSPRSWEAALAPADDPQQWSGALAAAEAGLLELADTGAARLHVCLSNQFVRYTVLPWSDELRSESEVHAFAQHRMREVYGELAASWQIALSAGWPGVPRIAAAVERALLEALVELAARARLRLQAVVPHFSLLADSRRRELRGAAFWLAAAESGRLVLARSERGEWRSLAAARDAGAPVAALLALLAREGFGLAEAQIPRRVYVDGLSSAERATLADAGWEAMVLGAESLPAGASV